MNEKDKGALLRAPFPADKVEWRPAYALHPHVCQGQPSRCPDQRDPSKHKQFAYVEDETVMDRLDEVFGVGGWSFKVDVVGEGVVRGSLIVHTASAEGDTTHQDFGYGGSGNSGEALKEASTDAFRRCGRMVGIARYIYARELEQAHRPSPRPAAPGRGEGAPRPSPQPLDIEDDGAWQGLLDAQTVAQDAEGVCPDHGGAWQHYAAGVSKKTGKAYEAGWSCETFGCRQRPSDGWKARHAA